MRRYHMRRYRFRHLTRRLCDAWYWLRCRLWHHYNVVVCRALPPTWCDRDYLLVFAAFQILEDFVKHEQPWEFTADVYAAYVTECGEEQAHEREAAWKTIRELYAWWQHRKADPDYDDYDEDSAMLHKLITVRGCLWT